MTGRVHIESSSYGLMSFEVCRELPNNSRIAHKVEKRTSRILTQRLNTSLTVEKDTSDETL